MSVLLAILFLYGLGVTIALICANSQKDRYIRKYIDIEKQYKELLAKVQMTKAEPNATAEPSAPTPAAPAAPAVPAPAVPPQTPFKPVNQAPAPSAQLPVYTRTATAPKELRKSNGLGAVGVSFAVGVLLMVIAAAVFISATWQTMLPGIKCVVLAIVVGVVYGLCTFSKKKLKLEKTASVLYMLGSLITPLAVVVGFLAFESKETTIMLACCALSLGLTGLIGYKIFGSKLHVAISYAGFVWVDIFICMKALGNMEGFIFGLAVASFISGLIYFLKPDTKFFNYFAEITAYVASLGALLSACILSAHTVLVITANVMYFASLLMLTRKRKLIKYFSALVPVYTLIFVLIQGVTENDNVIAVVYIAFVAVLFALYRVLKMDNPASNFIIAGITALLMYIYTENGDPSFLYYTALVLPILSSIAIIIMSRYKAERTVYMYLIYLPTMILLGDITSSYVMMYVFLGVAVLSVFAAAKFKNIHICIAAAAVSCITMISGIIDSGLSGNVGLHIIIVAAIVLALYTAVVFINKAKPFEKNIHLAARFSTLGLLIVSNMMLMGAIFNGDIVRFIALIVLDVIFEFVTLKDTDNYFGALPSATLMVGIVYKLAANEVNMMLSGALIILVFVVVGRIFINEHIVSKGRVDWLTFLAGAACFLPMPQLYRVTFLGTFFALTFIGRFASADSVEEKVKSRLKEILSAAVALFAISFAIVDVEISYRIDVEVRLLAILIGAAVIRFLIKPFEGVKWVWFSVVAFCLEVEALHAAGSGTLTPLTMVTLFGCGIFIYSFIVKKRSWFILAISVIAEFGVILAITFWESKLWWIYLLVLGGILIATASVNEYKRRAAIESGLEDKKIRLFDSWTW